MPRLLIAAAVLVAMGCAGPGSSQRTQPGATTEHANPAPSGSSTMAGICPMDVPGTTIRAADTPQGEALTFINGSGQENELRRRVRAMAMMHNEHRSGAPGAAREGSGSGDGANPVPTPAMMPPPASRATVEDVDKGIRMQVTPTDPSQVDQLRAAVRAHAERMQRDGCAMMGNVAH